MTSSSKSPGQPCVLGVPHQKMCHQVSGKGGSPQDRSSHPVTPFRRALTAYKTSFSLTNLAPDFLENKLSLNTKGLCFKVHPFWTCAKKRDCDIRNYTWGKCMHSEVLLIYSLSSIQPFHRKISAKINNNAFLLKIKFMKRT